MHTMKPPLTEPLNNGHFQIADGFLETNFKRSVDFIVYIVDKMSTTENVRYLEVHCTLYIRYILYVK